MCEAQFKTIYILQKHFPQKYMIVGQIMVLFDILFFLPQANSNPELTTNLNRNWNGFCGVWVEKTAFPTFLDKKIRNRDFTLDWMRRWSYELNPDRNLTADVTTSHAPLSLNKCALMITFIHIVLWVWEWLRRHKKVDLQLKALKIVFTCVCARVCVCGRGCRALSELLFRRLSWSKSCWTPYQTHTSCSHTYTHKMPFTSHYTHTYYRIYPTIHITSQPGLIPNRHITDVLGRLLTIRQYSPF